MKVIIRYILVLVSLFGFVGLKAQPVANFSASSTSGCSPLTNVQLTDISSGNPTSWIWKKNGTQFSTLQNAVTSFTSPGTYVIQLTATNSSGSSSFSMNITVYGNPTSNFTTNSSTTGCLPHTVSFQDNSSGNNSTITNWLWSFGDGGQSSAQNPSHTYSLAGNFPVSLKVIDNHGCEDTKQIPNYIQTYPLPNVSFSSSSLRQTCAPPLNVSFSNNSNGSGTLTYFWDFGDGVTSTQTNPSHTYTSMGQFNVKLVVTDGNGCSDSLIYSNFVQIQAISADFSASADSVCFGDSITFTNNTTGANIFNWNFGDNSTGIGFTTGHLYQDSGWFQVRMIASIPASGCSDTAYKNVYVQRVVADFYTSKDYICDLNYPDTIAYFNTSVNWDYQQWFRDMECPRDLSNGYRCGLPDTSDTAVYHFFLQNLERVYRDTLVVSSKLGCVDTMVEDTSVIVNLVRGSAILNKIKGCIPYTINFTGTAFPYTPSVSVPNPPVTLTGFEWRIDDTLYSTLQNPPSLTIQDTGTWRGTYTITNSLGCEWTDEFSFEAGDSVNADFMLLHDTICVSDRDTAISLSTDSTWDLDYIWFSNPAMGIGGDKVAYLNPGAIGSYDVGHIADHHGCRDTIVKTNAFYAQGPLVDFYPGLFNCSDSTKVVFTSIMQQAARWYWDFGDSTLAIDSVNLHPTVNYSKKGNYWVTLTAYSADSMCSDVKQDAVIAGEIRAVLNAKKNSYSPNKGDYNTYDTLHGCAPLTIHVTSDGSASTMIGDWYFDSNLVASIPRDSIISYTFNQRGFHEVILIVFDTVANCSDTTSMIVGAYSPEADFYGDPAFGCSPLNVVLRDSTSTLNKIVDYKWAVGSLTDTLDVFTNTFTGVNSLNAKLTVTDKYGCTDVMIKPDYVRTSSFLTDFYATSFRQICVGDSLKFNQVLNTNNVEFIWIYGNADTAYGKSAWLTFKDSGVFDVKLLSIDTISGCEKELVKPNYVRVQAYPDPDFYAIPTDSSCYPLPVQFYADTNMSYFDDLSFYWLLGDYSAASNFANPFYNYVKPGSYTITLIATTSYGCKDTIVKTDYINIGGPYAEIEMNDDSICIGDSILFQLKNPINVSTFGFDFGDGSSVLNSTYVWHTYTDSFGQIYPTLFFNDSVNGCPKTFKDTVFVFETEAKFSIIDTIGCVPFNPQINNQSTQANSYTWRFGDGSNSKAKNPNKIYRDPGTYVIFLKIKGNGCADSTTREIEVFPVPVAYAKSDTLICEGDSVQLYSGGGDFYRWTPPDELNDFRAQNPIAYPSYTVGYEVEVTDTNGCKDVDSVSIAVQNPILLPLEDLVMIVGDTLTLSKAYGGKGVTYKWIPPDGLSCDTCARPTLTALESGSYSVIVIDTNNCFEAVTNFYLEVQDKYTLDVPEAFTPNGDGVNDIVYVRGWGIRELITFKIYNRWGELIFESNDLSIGWDGTYKGKLQGVETFAYYVEALTYGNTVLTKKGNINLLR